MKKQPSSYAQKLCSGYRLSWQIMHVDIYLCAHLVGLGQQVGPQQFKLLLNLLFQLLQAMCAFNSMTKGDSFCRQPILQLEIWRWLVPIHSHYFQFRLSFLFIFVFVTLPLFPFSDCLSFRPVFSTRNRKTISPRLHVPTIMQGKILVINYIQTDRQNDNPYNKLWIKFMQTDIGNVQIYQKIQMYKQIQYLIFMYPSCIALLIIS